MLKVHNGKMIVSCIELCGGDMIYRKRILTVLVIAVLEILMEHYEMNQVSQEEAIKWFGV